MWPSRSSSAPASGASAAWRSTRPFLSAGAAERIVWATGAMAVHPRPLLEAFWELEMPRDLVEDYGLPELTPEIKTAILGGNAARILGLDVEGMKRRAQGDEFSDRAE